MGAWRRARIQTEANKDKMCLICLCGQSKGKGAQMQLIKSFINRQNNTREYCRRHKLHCPKRTLCWTQRSVEDCSKKDRVWSFELLKQLKSKRSCVSSGVQWKEAGKGAVTTRIRWISIWRLASNRKSCNERKLWVGTGASNQGASLELAPGIHFSLHTAVCILVPFPFV